MLFDSNWQNLEVAAENCRIYINAWVNPQDFSCHLASLRFSNQSKENGHRSEIKLIPGISGNLLVKSKLPP